MLRNINLDELPAHRRAHVELFAGELACYRNPLAITLTCKKGLPTYYEKAGKRFYTGQYAPVDRYMISQALRRFRHGLERAVLPRRAIRAGQRIPIITVSERAADGRLHFHIAADVPGDVDELRRLIGLLWQRQPVAYSEFDVQPIHSDGWITYMLKDISPSHNDFFFGIDWDNFSPFETQIAA